MFQIGTSLREARERRGLELADVERETRVRTRYLRALEEERFEQLPPGYRRTFLRGYANFLGLDADRFVDEYASRFERLEAAERVALQVPARGPRLPGRGIVALVGAALLTVALVAWLVPGQHSRHSAPASLAKRNGANHGVAECGNHDTLLQGGKPAAGGVCRSNRPFTCVRAAFARCSS